ncbi:hypothetical protein TNCV_804501 [Trichonephila clavipes]|nr:hypothetical protein TNCV_804501 [Trichonephila clavipes]
MPSTDQSSRRPPHRKKCTRTAKWYLLHPGTGSAFARGPVSSRTIRRRMACDGLTRLLFNMTFGFLEPELMTTLFQPNPRSEV